MIKTQTKELKPCMRLGAAAVEFAVIAPVLLIFVFGMIEVGRAIMVAQALSSTAVYGSRRAILPGVTSQQIENEMREYLTSIGVEGARATITTNPTEVATAEFGDPVSISINLAYSDVSATPVFIPKEITLRGASTMRSQNTSEP